MERFLLYSQNIKESLIYGYEAFPGEMLSPSSENILMSNEMLNIMVKYYKMTYIRYNFQRLFGEGPDDLIIIRVRMSQFGRYRIGSEIFSSKMSSRHVKSSFVLAKFIIEDDDINCYPSQIQYFFKYMVDLLNNRLAKHFLTYIR